MRWHIMDILIILKKKNQNASQNTGKASMWNCS